MGKCLSLSLEDNQGRLSRREEVWVKSWLAVTRAAWGGIGRQARVTSPPDFLQLHNPQPIITHHHPTAPAAVYQKAIVTTMNYNCADLQHDLALSVITQLPQHRAAEAPVLVKWNNFCEEKEGKYSVSGKLCSADCVLVSLCICL